MPEFSLLNPLVYIFEYIVLQFALIPLTNEPEKISATRALYALFPDELCPG